MSHPEVSILVRSMDRPTLARALDSIALQTWPALEIVVVAACGAGHRALPGVWRGRKVRFVVPDAPLRRAAAANVALAHARGAFCNFLDDDDEFLPSHAWTLATLLARQARCVVAYAKQQVVDEAGGVAGLFGSPWSRAALFEQPLFGMAAAMFRREAIQPACRFDERLHIGEDHDFWLECASRGAFVESCEVTSRWHAFIGTSGGGAGRNSDIAGKRAACAHIKRKWRAVRRAWLTTARGRLEQLQYALRELPREQCLRIAERTLAVLPEDVNALSLSALAFHRAGRQQQAVELVRRALVMAPSHPQLLANRRLIAGG